jgi:hypothetical protein
MEIGQDYTPSSVNQAFYQFKHLLLLTTRSVFPRCLTKYDTIEAHYE